MTIIQKLDNHGKSIILDNVVEIYKGDTIFTGCNSYSGWAVLNFSTNEGKRIQWDYGRIDEKSTQLRDEQYNKIIDLSLLNT